MQLSKSELKQRGYVYRKEEHYCNLNNPTIQNLVGLVYLFDYTILELYSIFCQAKSGKKKGGIEIHKIHDVEAHVPVFFHITTASVHDFQVKMEIPGETESYFTLTEPAMFLHSSSDSLRKRYFVVRVKKNLRYKVAKCKRRMSKNVFSDSIIEFFTDKIRNDYLQLF